MISVRHATTEDAEAISSVVCELAHNLLVDPEGEESKRFYAAMKPDELKRYMQMEDRFYIVAEVGSTVHGMIMVRYDNYIGQFFVSEAHQRRGVGNALWSFALATAKLRGSNGEFTVNSSLSAVPIYERFGFLSTGTADVQNGFKFIPMRRESEGAAWMQA
jgi:predicted GNAT family N-acyltransferase